MLPKVAGFNFSCHHSSSLDVHCYQASQYVGPYSHFLNHQSNKCAFLTRTMHHYPYELPGPDESPEQQIKQILSVLGNSMK